MATKTVSLVLGSGGARGLAHIGVINWLEENDFEIHSISGCSIGSLIGGVYAAGKLDELTNWMTSLDRSDIISLLDFSWSNGGIFKGDKIINTLKNFLEDIQIESLPIPFTAVAADIVTEREIWLNSGSLFDAVRASASLPLFFTPVKKGNLVLVDGGVLNPVPLAPSFKDETDLCIAVNLGGAPIEDIESSMHSDPEEQGGKFSLGVKRFISSLTEKKADSSAKSLSMYKVADRAFDTMQSTIARLKIASYPPDLEIIIPRNACGTFEFDKARDIIRLGYEKAKSAYEDDLMPRLKS